MNTLYQFFLLIPSAWTLKCEDINRRPQTQPSSYRSKDGPASRQLYQQHEQNVTIYNQEIPSVCDEAIRIISYNVHYHRDLEDKAENTDMVKEDLKQLNPTVVIFQEVHRKSKERERFNDMLDTLDLRHRLFAADGFLGNMIASRYPLEDLGYRNLGEARVVLAGGLMMRKTKIAIVGTHLDVYKPKLRPQQARDIVKFIESNVKPKYSDFVLGGDMNARWQSTEMQVFTSEGSMQEAFGATKAPIPNYTCWSGRTIDFLFLSEKLTSRAAGAYSYHNVHHSDHLPIIVDLLEDGLKVRRISRGASSSAKPTLTKDESAKDVAEEEDEEGRFMEIFMWLGIALAGIIIISILVYLLFFRKRVALTE